jgi:hypothetical protein
MSSRLPFTYNAPSGGAQQPQPDSSRDAFRSGGQTYETPQRPTVSVPRPNPSGRPSGEARGRGGR